MIWGKATREGTQSFADRFPEAEKAGHFRKGKTLVLSSVGLGTYLGEMDDTTDECSREAAEQCLLSGVNVIDSAINYRGQRSERVIGKVLANLAGESRIKREEVFISTKGGFIPFDSNYLADPAEYVREHFFRSGILKVEDIVQGCHAMTPKYLEHQLERSLENLGLDCIDLYYVHNPETQLEQISESAFYDRLTKAFELLERKVSEGKIAMYGMATWNGFRISLEERGYLSLKKVLEGAVRAGGAKHHFKAIQLPYNLGMTEAFLTQNQSWEGEAVSPIEYAKRASLLVFTSASLLQGRLTGRLPEKIRSLFPSCPSDASCALQFVRSTPGVTAALVGMKSLDHVSENLAVSKISPLPEESFLSLLVAPRQ